jgi:N-formylglutamate deformylase
MTDDDQKYLEAFESCNIAAGQFRHRDHVHVGWMMLNGAPLEDTLARFSRSLRRFANHHGATNLYHQTITWTYLFIINERKQRMDEGHDWVAFQEANPDLFENFRDFMGGYYSSEILESDLARHTYVLPNRAAAAVAC